MFASTKLVSWFAMLIPVVFSGTLGSEEPISYECTSFPEEVGWSRDIRPYADRWLSDGEFVQQAEVVTVGQHLEGQDDFYRRSLAQFTGAATLFAEWRMETDGPREAIPDVAPAALVLSGYMGILYHFTIARDRVRLIDSDLNVLYIDVDPQAVHTYRLELRADKTYVWFIDGTVVDSGPAPQPYPTADSRIVFGARASPGGPTITVWWDYIRLGEIAADGSGDYDSDEAVTLIDHYFVVECLTKDGPGIFGGPHQDAGPGCRFADFDADSDTDLLDFAEFQNRFGPQ